MQEYLIKPWDGVLKWGPTGRKSLGDWAVPGACNAFCTSPVRFANCLSICSTRIRCCKSSLCAFNLQLSILHQNWVRFKLSTSGHGTATSSAIYYVFAFLYSTQQACFDINVWSWCSIEKCRLKLGKSASQLLAGYSEATDENDGKLLCDFCRFGLWLG